MTRIKRHRVSKQLAKKEPEKKGISKQAIWTIILGSIMVFSVFGIMFSGYDSASDAYSYNDYNFKRTSLGWTTEVDGKDIEFNYLPMELENLNISKSASDRLLGAKVIYITFDPESRNVQKLELARFQLAMSLDQLFGTYSMAGVTKESEIYKQPVIDCNNATATVPVLTLADSNETSTVDIEGDCIILKADKDSIIAIKDRFLYQMLGIMD